MTVLALFIIVLHTADGREIDVSTEQITSMREAKPDNASGKDFAAGVRCMINTADGKFVTVIESCATVRQRIGETK
jgi:hypothetical protein